MILLPGFIKILYGVIGFGQEEIYVIRFGINRERFEIFVIPINSIIERFLILILFALGIIISSDIIQVFFPALNPFVAHVGIVIIFIPGRIRPVAVNDTYARFVRILIVFLAQITLYQRIHYLGRPVIIGIPREYRLVHL